MRGQLECVLAQLDCAWARGGELQHVMPRLVHFFDNRVFCAACRPSLLCSQIKVLGSNRFSSCP
jgi:hypothetical protein